MKRSQALDVVRGIAIVLVLIWHYLPRKSGITPEWLMTSTGMFWSGVDLFFVLSGFLIGGILLQQANSKKYFSTFYIRRAARIIPLYLLIFLLLVFVINWAPQYIAVTSRGHLRLWSYLTFTQNFQYAVRDKFNDTWMDATWSLAVEEQFYVALSLMVRILSKKKLAALTSGLIILAPILRFYAPTDMVGYVLPLQRADSLMLGVLLALAWQWTQAREFLRIYATAFRWLFFFLLLGAAYLTYRETRIGDPLGHFWLALLYGTFIVLALIKMEYGTGSKLFGNQVLEWFGLRSYGMYLFHQPMLALIPILISRFLHVTFSIWLTILICILALIVVSELSYRIIEKPIMAWGHRFTYD